MSRQPFNQVGSGLPQMSGAFSGWKTGLELVRVKQRIENGFVVDSREKFVYTGVVQPLSPKLLNLKPEGLRAFEWLQIHAQVGTLTLNLDVNDIIERKGKRYKVMGKLDYSDMGFFEYHVVEDYQPTPGERDE